MVIIDDQLLLDALAGAAGTVVDDAIAMGEVFTTGCWYYRLGRAVIAGDGRGSLARRFDALAPATRARTLSALDELPDEIGLLSLRDLVPVMQALRLRRPPNLLNAEALAAALLLDATLMVSTDSPLLRSGAADLDIEYQLRS